MLPGSVTLVKHDLLPMENGEDMNRMVIILYSMF